MAGTALAAAAILVAGGAVAADKKMMKPSVSVNGYFESVVGGVLDEDITKGGADAVEDTSAIDTKNDSEIHFNARGMLDNGMKYHARVELEGMEHHADADTIDEYFLSVSGSFGQIKFGGTAGAPATMLLGVSGSFATNVGESLSYDTSNWIEPQAGPGLFPRLDAGDAEKLTYISPKFGGFQIGLTYSPNMVNDDNWERVDAETKHHDGFEGAALYGGKFGDVGFAVGAGMTAYQGPNDGSADDLSEWLVGARIDFGGGFRVSAAHKRVTNDDEATQGQVTDVGVRFVTGANSFSLVGSQAEMDKSGDKRTRIMGSYARAMGPGVKVHTNLLHIDGESGDGSASSTGLVAISGIKVSF